MSGVSGSSSGSSNREFHTTRWTIVFSAKQQSTELRQAALSELCRLYWYPIYAFVRRKGNSAHDAQELTQSFFLSALQRDTFQRAQPERGRLRSFLLKAVQNHLISEHRKAVNRDLSNLVHLESDFEQDSERRYIAEPVTLETPERLFHRRWTITLLNEALRQLTQELTQQWGESVAQSMVSRLDQGSKGDGLAVVAEQLQISESALKVRLHRMRKRYRELLRSLIASTVEADSDIENELRELFDFL